LDFIFLTCIDLEKAFNKLVIVDDKTKIMLEEVLNLHFKNGVADRKGVLMRKEIVPLTKEILESHKP